MKVSWRIAALACVAALAAPAVAAGADYCVRVSSPGCVAKDDLAAALAAAAADAAVDRVLLGGGSHRVPSGTADAPGAAVEIEGRAADVTLVADSPPGPATLQLLEPGSRLTGVRVEPPAGVERAVIAAGVLREVVAAGAVELLAGGRFADGSALGVSGAENTRLERSSVTGPVQAEGAMVMENVDVAVAGAAVALEAACGSLTARHVTLTGSADVALRAACPGRPASLELRNSLVHGEFEELATVTPTDDRIRTSFSAHAADDDVESADRLSVANPGLGADRRPGAGSPLVDAGAREPLGTGEGSFDAKGDMRVVDGDGDGVARRDVGAYERRGAVPPSVPGNVLANPGAEEGLAGWTQSGTIATLAYGTVERSAAGGEIVMPTLPAAAALGAGGAFFSGDGVLLQRIDVAGSAAQIDTGGASASLSGLVGGYGADEDEVVVRATFRDPEGRELGSIAIGPAPPAQRSNATMLLHRSAAGAIPARTRAVDVSVTGTRITAPGMSESYTDAFADNLGLQLTVPGVPIPGPVDPGDPPVHGLKPFNGITVLTARPRLSRSGRTRVRVACASATVGACRGTLELRAQLRRGMGFRRIARFDRFTVAPGRAVTRTLRLRSDARRILRARRSFLATLRAVVRDGQGLERRTTIPLRVRRRR